MSSFSRKWRKRWGLTQNQAASALQVTDRTIRKYDKELPKIAEYAMRYLSIKWRDEK